MIDLKGCGLVTSPPPKNKERKKKGETKRERKKGKKEKKGTEKGIKTGCIKKPSGKKLIQQRKEENPSRVEAVVWRRRMIGICGLANGREVTWENVVRIRQRGQLVMWNPMCIFGIVACKKTEIERFMAKGFVGNDPLKSGVDRRCESGWLGV